MRRLAILTTLLGLACGGGAPPRPPAPQSTQETLQQFLAAVQAKDLQRMGDLWGTERGPASGWMKGPELQQRLTVIQKYLAHVGYRVVEGPLAGTDAGRRTYRVELQRRRCNAMLPIDLVRAKSGGWLVFDVHLEAAGNPAAACPPADSGTRP